MVNESYIDYETETRYYDITVSCLCYKESDEQFKLWVAYSSETNYFSFVRCATLFSEDRSRKTLLSWVVQLA